MAKVVNYLFNRTKAWEDYYHLRRLPDRLLEDMGIERQDLKSILKNPSKR